MDPMTRWETEAIRKRPPKPSQTRPKDEKSKPEQHDRGPSANWVTLKEAEQATGIPTNTIRKWARRNRIPTYLESDGEVTLRMVDIDAVRVRAADLGRELTGSRQAPSTEPDTIPEPEVAPESEDSAPPLPPDTMIVPIDAWNKMLNQLGNLHEAGQQLAEARERAAKAETESTFLRAQLADMRMRPEGERRAPDDAVPEPQLAAPPSKREEERTVPDEAGSPVPTTTYWRYLTTGWRDRKRRR